MSQDRIIQIAAVGELIYGLTESGKLVFFDKAVSKFVLRSSEETITIDKANVLKKPMAVIPTEPQGRHRHEQIEKTVPKKKWWIPSDLIFLFLMAVILVTLAWLLENY